jgi:hypothetical protein
MPVPVTSLLLPTLLSAVLVFLASSIIHMVLKYHSKDYRKVEKEDELLDAFRRLNVGAADYCMPYAGSAEAMKDPAFLEKCKKGPTVLMTVIPGREIAMGAQLGQWFLYSVVISLMTGFIAGTVLPPGEDYHEVFHLCALVSFMGYAMALPPFSIWYKRNWGTTMRSMVDGLFYALLTAGTFGWLWP